MEIRQVDHHGRTLRHNTVISQAESGHLAPWIDLQVAPRNSSIGLTENVDDFEGGTAFGKKGLNRG